MFFYVVECFSVNLKKLAADAVRSAEVGGIDEQVESERGFVAVTFGETPHEVDQIGGLDANGAEVGDKGAEVGAFVADGLLEVGEAGSGLVRGSGDAAAEDVELNLNAEEGLQNAVVEVAGDAGAFGFDGTGS